MNKNIILLLTFLLLGYLSLDLHLFFRLLIGLGFGVALVSASMGFAGGVNRLYRGGSATLAKTLMYMFFLTALLNTTLLFNGTDAYNLSIFPINNGLILGGLMFGFGMALSSCCATGSLTDIASGFSRAVVTIIFFSIGVFLGFNTQITASWTRESWFTSQTGSYFQGGVYLPDLFLFDGFNGYLGALILTALFAFIAIKVAIYYEKKHLLNLNTNIDSSIPKAMKISLVVISMIFFILFMWTLKGWSATTAFGLWFSKILMSLGISDLTLSEFSAKPIEFFNTPLLEHSTTVQNIGIVFGSIFVLVFKNSFKGRFISGLRITKRGFITFAFGGFIMGFGTRLSHGCNVGALYTPIAEFSLSGWVYLVVVVVGGVAGNWFLKNYISSTCTP